LYVSGEVFVPDHDLNDNLLRKFFTLVADSGDSFDTTAIQYFTVQLSEKPEEMTKGIATMTCDFSGNAKYVARELRVYLWEVEFDWVYTGSVKIVRPFSGGTRRWE